MPGAVPGDNLLDHVTADSINRWNRAARSKKEGIPAQPLTNDYNTVTVYNHSTTAKKQYDVVALDTAKVTYGTSKSPAYSKRSYNTKAIAGTFAEKIAILQEPLPGVVGAAARALLCGVSWVRVPTTLPADTAKRFISTISGGTQFDYYGRIEIEYVYSYESGYLGLGQISMQTPLPAGAVVLKAGSGITAASGTTSRTLGKGTCEQWNGAYSSGSGNLVFTASGVNRVVFNLTNLSIPSGSYIIANWIQITEDSVTSLALVVERILHNFTVDTTGRTLNMDLTNDNSLTVVHTGTACT